MASSLRSSLREMDRELYELHIASTEFNNLTTNEDRFIWVRKHMSAELSKSSSIASAASKWPMRSASISERYRIDGNKYFKDKLYEKALDLYTKSMIAAPGNDSGGCFSKSLCNRSAALFYLKEYKACLIDIEESLEAGYTEERQYLLYIRKVKCHHELQQFPAAKLAYNKVDELLSKSKIDSEQHDKILIDLEKYMASAKMSNAEVKRPKRAKGGLQSLLHSKNVSHPSLSSSCKVKYNKKKGRYIVATRDIRPGEVILVEEAYTSLLTKGGYDMYCHHCCSRLPIAPLSCPDCTKCLFCSPVCRDRAMATYHKYECEMGTPKTIHLYHMALRIALVAGINELLKYGDDRKASGMAGCDEEGVYKSCDFNAVKQLSDHADKEAELCMFQMAERAVTFVRSLENTSFFQSISPGERESARLCVGKCLIHFMQVFKVNGLAIPAVQGQGTPTANDEIGLGLYLTYSLFNHSCDSNSLNFACANNVVIWAGRTIKEGEEISISYGPKFQEMEREERQNILQRKFHFECSCDACVNKWPLVFYMPPDKSLARFKCQNCNRALCASSDECRKAAVQCQGCKQPYDIHKTETMLKDLQTRCEHVKALLSAKRFSEAFDATRDGMEKFEKIYFITTAHLDFLEWEYLLEQCLFGQCLHEQSFVRYTGQQR